MCIKVFAFFIVVYSLSTVAEATQTTEEQFRIPGDLVSSEKDYIGNENQKKAFKVASQHAQALIGWALMIIAGSVATIVSTSYIQPLNRKVRLIYLLFLPGWWFLFLSMHRGRNVYGNYLASLFAKDINLLEISKNINENSYLQITNLGYGMVCFALWLIAFLIWWIFFELVPNKQYNIKELQ